MITQELLNSYKKYNGDIDAWSRRKSPKKNEDNDWFLISSFLQDLKLAKGNLTSVDYRSNLETQITENCDNALTVAELIAMIEVTNSKNSAKKPWWRFSEIALPSPARDRSAALRVSIFFVRQIIRSGL